MLYGIWEEIEGPLKARFKRSGFSKKHALHIHFNANGRLIIRLRDKVEGYIKVAEDESVEFQIKNEKMVHILEQVYELFKNALKKHNISCVLKLIKPVRWGKDWKETASFTIINLPKPLQEAYSVMEPYLNMYQYFDFPITFYQSLRKRLGLVYGINRNYFEIENEVFHQRNTKNIVFIRNKKDAESFINKMKHDYQKGKRIETCIVNSLRKEFGSIIDRIDCEMNMAIENEKRGTTFSYDYGSENRTYEELRQDLQKMIQEQKEKLKRKIMNYQIFEVLLPICQKNYSKDFVKKNFFIKEMNSRFSDFESHPGLQIRIVYQKNTNDIDCIDMKVLLGKMFKIDFEFEKTYHKDEILEELARDVEIQMKKIRLQTLFK